MITELFSQPHTYDSYITTNIEKRNFDEVAKQIFQHHTHPSILDLCCGTGIFARRWLSQSEIKKFLGVDINKVFIEYANKYSFGEFRQGDAVDIRLAEKFDVVLGNSAYHHIQDDRKTDFLENMKYHREEDGSIIIYEKFIAPFSNPTEAAISGTSFYLERIKEIYNEQQINEKQISSLLLEIYMTSSRKIEYKVPFERFYDDVNKAGLNIVDEIKLWPLDDRFGNPKVGDFVVVLK